MKNSGFRRRILDLALILAVYLGCPINAGLAAVTANQLVLACSLVVSSGVHLEPGLIDVPDRAEAGLCLGYLSAILGATQYVTQPSDRVLRICTPAKMDALVLLDVTKQYLSEHSELGSEEATKVVLSAARIAFPCAGA